VKDPLNHPATIVDVARAAGVSKSTAGRALANYGVVSEAARVKVRAAAARLGYTPNNLARSMITGNTQTLGVVLPDISNSYFSTALQGISAAARSAGFEVLVASTENDIDLERRAVQLLAAKRVDGLIVAPVAGEDSRHLQALANASMPIVLLDRPVSALPGASYVSVGNIDASRLAVEHLISLGHSHIGIVSEAPFDLSFVAADDAQSAHLRPGSARMAGYMRALNDAGLPLRADYVAHAARTSASSYDATLELVRSNPSITAIYCTYNVLSAGAFAALQDSGLACPDDISIIGFDDHEWATLVRPQLTVIAQPTYEIGVAVADEILATLREPGTQRSSLLLQARLVVRDSTGRARSRAEPSVVGGRRKCRGAPTPRSSGQTTVCPAATSGPAC